MLAAPGGRDPARPADRLAGPLLRRVLAAALAVRRRRHRRGVQHRRARRCSRPDPARGRRARRTIADLAAAFGLVTLTLQIAYLPTLYSAFNRRETEVALLNARAGVPSWGPELLARTHYALGSGMSTIDTLPDLYAQWERWAADVAESHTTYLPLVRFRSPGRCRPG